MAYRRKPHYQPSDSFDDSDNTLLAPVQPLDTTIDRQSSLDVEPGLQIMFVRPRVPQFAYWPLHPRVMIYLLRRANKLFDAGMMRLNARRPGGRKVIAISKNLATGKTTVSGIAVYRKMNKTLELYGCICDSPEIYAQLMLALAEKARLANRSFVEATCQITNLQVRHHLE